MARLTKKPAPKKRGRQADIDLDSILPVPSFDTAAVRELAGDNEGLKLIQIDLVKPRPNQPRRFFDRKRLTELAHDIAEMRGQGGGIGGTGIIQPLLVVQNLDGTGFILTAGERRWRAAQEAGNTEVPALIREQSDQDAYEDALRENIQREDLTVLEEAEAMRSVMDYRHLTVRQASERFGKDKTWIENRLAVLRMQPDIQEMVAQRRDSLFHAHLIEPVKDARLRRELIKAVIDGLSVAKLRERIAEYNAENDERPPAPVTLRAGRREEPVYAPVEDAKPIPTGRGYGMDAPPARPYGKIRPVGRASDFAPAPAAPPPPPPNPRVPLEQAERLLAEALAIIESRNGKSSYRADQLKPLVQKIRDKTNRLMKVIG